MCEKCKNYEEKTSVSIPPKGTPMREIKTGRIFFSTGIKKDNKIQLSQSIDHTSDYSTWLSLPEEMEVVEITPVKTAPQSLTLREKVPPEGAIVEVWDEKTKPKYPEIRRSTGEMCLITMKDGTTGYWKHWEIVRQ